MTASVSSLYAQNLPGQTLQINTWFRSIAGKPTWLIIIRDIENNEAKPYLFDISQHENYWVLLNKGHTYRVTSSRLTFGPFAAINNFCGLQNGTLTNTSMFITITGDLTPDPASSVCRITKYATGQ